MSEVKNCPKCQADLEGEDIYQHFLGVYTQNSSAYYTQEYILDSIQKYPELYSGLPNEDELKKLSAIELNALYTARMYGWTPQTPRKFKQEVGIEIPNYHDGVVLWRCPACNFVWKRFNWVTDEIPGEIQREIICPVEFH